jgi:predicted dehydrogenase
MKPLRVGILGQGRSGRDIHAACLASSPRKYRIVVVSDPLEKRSRRAEREFGCEGETDYRRVLRRDDLDLIVNATPSHLHVPITRQALRAGHDVLCEKPVARRARDVDALVDLARKMGRTLGVFQQARYHPTFVQVRKVVDSGVLGRVVQVRMAANGFARRWDWQTLQEMNGGSLLNTGPHSLDQALMLFDPSGEMPEVWCRMDRATTFGDAEDHVKLMLTGPNRPMIDLEVSSCCAYPLYSMQVYGTCGGLTALGGEVKWRWFDPRRAPKQELIRTPLPGPSFCHETLPWRERTWKQPDSVKDLFGYMSSQYYDGLRSALTEGRPLEVTLAQVRRQIAVIERCHRMNPLSRISSEGIPGATAR